MKKQRLNCSIGERIKQHLELRRSLGFIYKSASHDLDAFHQHVNKYFPNCKTISRELIVSYLDSTRHLTARTRYQKVSNLRQFCRFMFQFDPNTYIPERDLVSPGMIQVKPHIFAEEEIIKVIEQTKNFRGKHSLLPYTYSTIIALLWVTGMRIGEVVNLKIEDVDTVNGIIYIRQTKFFKSRLITLSESSTQALIKYKQRRADIGYSEEPETPFFFNNRGKPCITATTPRTIRELFIQAGLKTIQGKTPRVHDIRHTFATRWLLDFYVVRWDGKTPSPSGEYFSIIREWNISTVRTVSTI